MATPNKFSNPDTPCCDCPVAYLRCFVTGPLFSVLCLPCVCVQAWRQERGKGTVQEVPMLSHGGGGGRRAESSSGGGGGAKTDGGAVVGDAPVAEPPMFDAALPRSQWPAEWRNRNAMG